MSQQIGGYPPATGAGTPTGQPTTQVARDEAGEVGRTAADAGSQVAGTAAEQAANVAQEAKTQARDLVGEARGQVGDQARMGQQKATDGIRTLGRELREMADGGQQSGTASEVARRPPTGPTGSPTGWANASRATSSRKSGPSPAAGPGRSCSERRWPVWPSGG